MRILVFGAGVIGSVYAAHLLRAGHEVTLLARGQRLADLTASGLVVENAESGHPGGPAGHCRGHPRARWPIRPGAGCGMSRAVGRDDAGPVKIQTYSNHVRISFMSLFTDTPAT